MTDKPENPSVTDSKPEVSIEVSAADRDAAADLISHYDQTSCASANMRSGHADQSWAVKAFASHRVAHQSPLPLRREEVLHAVERHWNAGPDALTDAVLARIADTATPLVFYDASDPQRRVATLAEALERGNGKVAVTGWRKLIADLNAAPEQEAARLRADREKLVEGLRPFAREADSAEDRYPSHSLHDSIVVTARLGDFRRARTLLIELEQSA